VFKSPARLWAGMTNRRPRRRRGPLQGNCTMVEKMAETRHEGGVSYHVPDSDYFDQRELRRHAGVFYLWALGVAAVISGDFSGWNLGFAVGGWGGMFVGTIIITIMYLGLTY